MKTNILSKIFSFFLKIIRKTIYALFYIGAVSTIYLFCINTLYRIYCGFFTQYCYYILAYDLQIFTGYVFAPFLIIWIIERILSGKKIWRRHQPNYEHVLEESLESIWPVRKIGENFILALVLVALLGAGFAYLMHKFEFISEMILPIIAVIILYFALSTYLRRSK